MGDCVDEHYPDRNCPFRGCLGFHCDKCGQDEIMTWSKPTRKHGRRLLSNLRPYYQVTLCKACYDETVWFDEKEVQYAEEEALNAEN